jgi:hypothetical protein
MALEGLPNQTWWSEAPKPADYEVGTAGDQTAWKRMWLDTAAQRVAQQKTLGTLYGLATGAQSTAREEGTAQTAAMNAAIQAQAAGAQRGRFDPAAVLAAQTARAASTQGIAGQTAISAAGERTAAAGAFQTAADTTAKDRMAFEATARGYQTAALADKYNAAKLALQKQLELGEISWDQYLAKMGEDEAAQAEEAAAISAAGTVLSTAAMAAGSDRRMKTSVRGGVALIDEFLRAARR